MSPRLLLLPLCAVLLGCGRADDGVVRFWAMGREAEAVATVDGQVACQAEFSAMIDLSGGRG